MGLVCQCPKIKLSYDIHENQIFHPTNELLFVNYYFTHLGIHLISDIGHTNPNQNGHIMDEKLVYPKLNTNKSIRNPKVMPSLSTVFHHLIPLT